jgi:glycosyltransferase involved in cell wall biosynthesis
MNPNLPTVEIAVPVFNEERTLETNVEVLLDYLRTSCAFGYRVVIVDNASVDSTSQIGETVAGLHQEVSFRRLERKGRGLALRTAWLESDADVVSYMDVDLSTNLKSFGPLVEPLLTGDSDLAIGTRLVRQARVQRRWKRELLSRGYNLLVRVGFGATFSDAQCGFKAIRTPVARQLVPLVRDDGWFFDTELLLLAERNGFRIHEVPVEWIEDLDSRVDLIPTVVSDLSGLWRVRRSFWRGEGRLSGASVGIVPSP